MADYAKRFSEALDRIDTSDPMAAFDAYAALYDMALVVDGAICLPEVRRLRPGTPWEDVLRIVNSGLPREAQLWSLPRLIRAAKTFVREALLSETILARASAPDKNDRLPAIVAGIKGADPKMTLQALCDRLEAMRERTPRGRTSWQPSSVKMLLERAERLGLL